MWKHFYWMQVWLREQVQMGSRDSLFEDFDECDYGTHDCSEIEECEIGGGSFACICKLSYEQNDNLGVCEDIGECVLRSHNCVQAESKFCFNILGSFVCG